MSAITTPLLPIRKQGYYGVKIMKLKVRMNFVVLTEYAGEVTRAAKVGKNY